MKVLVLGGSGMLGHKVFQVLSPRFEAWVTFRGSASSAWQHPMFAHVQPGRVLGGVDAFNFDGIVGAMAACRPDVLVNCVGIVKQLRETHDPILSLSVNSLLPHRLAGLAAACGARLIQVSTDCVFSGAKGAYRESDPPDCQDLYGRTKLLGEVDGPGCITIRTSIIGRELTRSTALVEWFLKNRGGRVHGYRKAIFSGFPTISLARTIGDIIESHPALSGVYHVASEPINKYDLLVGVRDALKVGIEIDAADGPLCDRSLDPSRFIAATGYRIPSWDELFRDMANDSTPYDIWRR